MTPDPALDRLVRFTPDPTAVDPAEILFRAGRASARTPRGWKLAVAGLLLANAATALVLVARGRPPAPPPERLTVPVVVPVVISLPDPEQPAPPAGSESPWSVGALSRTIESGALPRPEPATGLAPADRPLTLLTARRGEID